MSEKKKEKAAVEPASTEVSAVKPEKPSKGAYWYGIGPDGRRRNVSTNREGTKPPKN
jgi:hypothetical protein